MRAIGKLLAIVMAVAVLAIPLSVALAQDPTLEPLMQRGDPQFGRILTDANGMTVYTWQGDAWGTGSSSCYDACASAWPPVLVDEGQAMGLMGGMSDEIMTPDMPEGTMMPNPEGVGVLVRTDGTYQLTYNGYPLYYFARDTAPGDKNGQGSMGFGALWAVVVP